MGAAGQGFIAKGYHEINTCNGPRGKRGFKILIELRGFGEGVEGGNGFDQARDGKGIEDAARFADEVEDATFATEGDGHADERGDAGAVNLRNAVEIDDDFARAFLKDGSESGGELVAGIANGQAAVEVENANTVLFVDVNFDGSVLGHVGRSAVGHYTTRRGMAGK
jgi:hypothetical protein